MKGGYDAFFKQARQAATDPKVVAQRGGTTNKTGKKIPLNVRRQTPDESPEQRLRRLLADRAKSRKPRRKAPPLWPVIMVAAGVTLSAVGYFNLDIAEELSQSIEIGFLGAALAQGSNTQGQDVKGGKPAAEPPTGEKSAGDRTRDVANSSAATTSTDGGAPLSVRDWTPEELSFFNKLSERKKELDQREVELVKLEEELQRQKAELDEKIQQLETIRSEISMTLKDRVENDQEKVLKLVEFYSNMKPQQAAKILETINEDLAVEVLDKMKKKNAADIMNMLDAKKAQKLSERLAGYRRPQ